MASTPPLLVTNLVNIRYLSGVELTAGYLLLRSRSKILFVDGRYSEKAEATAKKGIRIQPIGALGKWLKPYKRIRFEADDVTVSRLTRWEKRYRKIRFVPSEGVVEELRRKKMKREIEAIREACNVTDKVIRKIGRGLARQAPTTEKQLAWEIQKLSHDLGADAMAFDTIVAFGNHTSRPHHSPTDRKLKKGDLIQIDMGVKVDGYCSDCSRVFFTANPTKEQWQVFRLLQSVVADCTRLAKAKATNHMLDKKARDLIRTGYDPYQMTSFITKMTKEKTLDEYFTHGLGHGLGLEIHEGARLSTRADRQSLKESEVITIEPGLYFPGKWGMRIEDTVLVRKSFGERLTKSPYRTNQR